MSHCTKDIVTKSMNAPRTIMVSQYIVLNTNLVIHGLYIRLHTHQVKAHHYTPHTHYLHEQWGF